MSGEYALEYWQSKGCPDKKGCLSIYPHILSYLSGMVSMHYFDSYKKTIRFDESLARVHEVGTGYIIVLNHLPGTFPSNIPGIVFLSPNKTSLEKLVGSVNELAGEKPIPPFKTSITELVAGSFAYKVKEALKSSQSI